LIERIEVHKGEERGNPEVILIGALSEILAFTQSKTTASPNGDSGRGLRVAGAGNHLYRTNLLWNKRSPDRLSVVPCPS